MLKDRFFRLIWRIDLTFLKIFVIITSNNNKTPRRCLIFIKKYDIIKEKTVFIPLGTLILVKIFVIMKRERIKNKSLTYFLRNVKRLRNMAATQYQHHQEEQDKAAIGIRMLI